MPRNTCEHALQKANFEFFILKAMGINSVQGQDMRADYFVVVNGDVCTPCKAFDPILSYVSSPFSAESHLRYTQRLMPHVTHLHVTGPRAPLQWKALHGCASHLA